jgi:hypothetical protein
MTIHAAVLFVEAVLQVLIRAFNFAINAAFR